MQYDRLKLKHLRGSCEQYIEKLFVSVHPVDNLKPSCRLARREEAEMSEAVS